MEFKVFSGSANEPLGEAVAAELGVRMAERELQRFPDGEMHVELKESVRGADVYLLQPTSPPVERHLLELLLLADAARRAGAFRLTAVIPYFGYARQDRRTRGREAVGARLVAELMGTGRLLQRVVAVDVHTEAIEGFFGIPLEHLGAVPTLVERIRPYVQDNSVIVGPDLGATKLAETYAEALRLPVAMVHKTRLSGSEVSVGKVTGEVEGLTPIIVDDMISTGGTIEAAAEALLEEGCEPEITVVASHGLFAGDATGRLAETAVERFVVTDSVPPPDEGALPLETVSLAPLVADAMGRLHEGRSLGDLLYRA